MSSDRKINVPRTGKIFGRLRKREKENDKSSFSLALIHTVNIFQYFLLQILLKTDFYEKQGPQNDCNKLIY